jgi:hypothetical protein
MSEDQLRLDRLVVLSHVQLGAVYRHSPSGKHYVAKDVAMSEKDMEPVVIYSPLTAAGVVWTRPFKEWQEKFKKINDPRSHL